MENFDFLKKPGDNNNEEEAKRVEEQAILTSKVYNEHKNKVIIETEMIDFEIAEKNKLIATKNIKLNRIMENIDSGNFSGELLDEKEKQAERLFSEINELEEEVDKLWFKRDFVTSIEN